MKEHFLIVVDMQNDFIDGALGTKEAEQIVDNVVAKIEAFEGRILVTKDTHFQNYLETQEGKNLPVVHCVKDTFGWELNQKVAEALAKKDTVEKTYMKLTFGSEDLGVDLQKFNASIGVEDITLIGLCTDICVISNAMIAKAFVPEIPIKVDAKCCAGVTPESHKNALEAMKMCQIEIIE